VVGANPQSDGDVTRISLFFKVPDVNPFYSKRHVSKKFSFAGSRLGVM